MARTLAASLTFTEIPNGVRFADVRPGSPAAKAGLKAGDILIEFDGKKIQNLYDFTYALTGQKAWPRSTCEGTPRGPND